MSRAPPAAGSESTGATTVEAGGPGVAEPPPRVEVLTSQPER